MKKSYFKLLITMILMLLVLMFNIFNNNVFSENITAYSIYLALIFFVLYMMVGFEKESSNHNLDVFRKVFVYTVIYLMVIYILGFVIGFVKNPYSMEIFKIIKNIFFPFLIIVFEELIRYNIIKKANGKKNLIVLITLIMILSEISRSIDLYSFKTGMEIFEVFGILIIPSIVKNILFSYICFKGFYKVNILYRSLITLNPYFLPIYPDLGVYLESILNIIIPTLIYVGISSIFYNQRLIFKKEMNYKNKIILLPSSMLLIITIILTSGIFKYYAMSVGSLSMFPTINKGDVVVVEKVDMKKIKIDDILVHKHGGKIILHRIISTNYDKTCFYTKGDNNETPDSYEICEKDIEGIVVMKIPFVGIPSVKLEEFLSKRGK